MNPTKHSHRRYVSRSSALVAYLIFIIIMGIGAQVYNEQDTKNQEQDKLLLEESARIDQALCLAANDTRITNNNQNQAMRNIVSSSPNVRRDPELLEIYLGAIPADQPFLDCSKFGTKNPFEPNNITTLPTLPTTITTVSTTTTNRGASGVD